MRRVFIILGAAVFIIGGALAAGGASSGATGKQYKIVFDNAFGLVKGADFKVGGVAVGSIKDLGVTDDARALVTVQANEGGKGFAGLRPSATCTVNPQSLIGEYFVDCQPGKTGAPLKDGATIPVTHTTSPIPPDLVLNVMRKPIAERFSIVFSELGAGFAARGNDVNETISRAIPALQTTDDVLNLLARNKQTLADLSREGGQVLKVLGERRADVGAFVLKARDAASATADRREQLAQTFHRFPAFLDELTPTMTDLGIAARQQTPALADLRAAAPTVTNLLQTLQPFSRASLPAVTSLGSASLAGRTASREAASLVGRLGVLGQISPEPAKNLRFILEHLDDRANAVEPDSDSPGGKGYTGLEAPLQYIFDQSLSANTFDQRGYSLKINLSVDGCGNYTTADQAKADTATYEKCNQNLGPNQPAINQPDPSTSSRRFARPTDKTARKRGTRGAPKTATPGPGSSDAPAPAATATPAPSTSGPLQPVQDLLNSITDPVTGLLAPLSGGDAGSSTQPLLDYLLKP
ncbi:MAG: hypothetical protein QOF76_4722 [Solirubrobacteraceae bacterium]|jgi:virulence factor Mce-like protein|nr:hypothetical protein [Solirubrobacteraceae bacterium]